MGRGRHLPAARTGPRAAHRVGRPAAPPHQRGRRRPGPRTRPHRPGLHRGGGPVPVHPAEGRPRTGAGRGRRRLGPAHRPPPPGGPARHQDPAEPLSAASRLADVSALTRNRWQRSSPRPHHARGGYPIHARDSRRSEDAHRSAGRARAPPPGQLRRTEPERRRAVGGEGPPARVVPVPCGVRRHSSTRASGARRVGGVDAVGVHLGRLRHEHRLREPRPAPEPDLPPARRRRWRASVTAENRRGQPDTSSASAWKTRSGARRCSAKTRRTGAAPTKSISTGRRRRAMDEPPGDRCAERLTGHRHLAEGLSDARRPRPRSRPRPPPAGARRSPRAPRPAAPHPSRGCPPAPARRRNSSPTTPHLVWSATTTTRRAECTSRRLVSASARFGVDRPASTDMPCTPRKSRSKWSAAIAWSATGPTSRVRRGAHPARSAPPWPPPAAAPRCALRRVEDVRDPHRIRDHGQVGHLQQVLGQRGTSSCRRTGRSPPPG